jgi:hypothetical protein
MHTVGVADADETVDHGVREILQPGRLVAQA